MGEVLPWLHERHLQDRRRLWEVVPVTQVAEDTDLQCSVSDSVKVVSPEFGRTDDPE